ncbi:MAG: hypothetical protein IKU73_08070 [Clostridia bacterium]|nr:hypothetical protein [Clostridia bacterium]
MKEHLSAILRSTATALADAALGALLIALMLALYDAERSVSLAVGVFASIYLLQAIINEIMTARGTSLLVYLLVNAALLIPGVNAALSHTVFTPASMGFPFLLRAVLLIAGAHGALCMRRLPGSNVFVRYADALIAVLVLYLFSAFSLGRAYNTIVLCFALCVLALCMTIASVLRSGGESDSVIRGAGAGGFAVLLGLLLLCLLFTAGALSLGSGHIGGIVTLLSLLWQGVCSAGNLLLNIFARFILLFAGMGGNMRSDPASSAPAGAEGMEIVEAAAAPAWLPALLLGLLGAAVLAGVVALLLALRGMKFSRVTRTKKKRRVVRRSHFLSALLAALRGAYDVAAFEIAYRLHKATPQGLFVLAQRTGKLRRFPRRASESAGAYLRRYHAALLSQGEDSPLASLADALDRTLYGGQSVHLSRAESRLCARAIRRLGMQPRPGSDVREG